MGMSPKCSPDRKCKGLVNLRSQMHLALHLALKKKLWLILGCIRFQQSLNWSIPVFRRVFYESKIERIFSSQLKALTSKPAWEFVNRNRQQKFRELMAVEVSTHDTLLNI